MRNDKLRQDQERKTYYRQLRDLLTEEVQDAFKELYARPTPRMSELIERTCAAHKLVSALGGDRDWSEFSDGKCLQDQVRDLIGL